MAGEKTGEETIDVAVDLWRGSRNQNESQGTI